MYVILTLVRARATFLASDMPIKCNQKLNPNSHVDIRNAKVLRSTFELQKCGIVKNITCFTVFLLTSLIFHE